MNSEIIELTTGTSVVKIFKPTGMLESINGGRLRQEVTQAIDSGVRVILIDCHNISFVDSSGLGALVLALKKMREVSGRLALCCINDQLKMLLELTGINQVFEVLPNQDKFLQSIGLEPES